jgi:hypothetical protein
MYYNDIVIIKIVLGLRYSSHVDTMMMMMMMMMMIPTIIIQQHLPPVIRHLLDILISTWHFPGSQPVTYMRKDSVRRVHNKKLQKAPISFAPVCRLSAPM